MKDKLLFVTKGGEGGSEGFSYVLELARMLEAGVEVLMVYKKRMMQSFEDVMTMVAFAEAGEHEMVKDLMNRQKEEIKEGDRKRISNLVLKGVHASVDVSCEVAVGEFEDVVLDTLREKPNIVMVLLSPGISGGRDLKTVKKLLREISKPIVTITRPENAGA